MKTIAVLGAGIMGSSVALFLARHHRVVLFDRAPAPFCGASRWNEGKIHRGFLYSADPSLATARRLMPGGLTFRSIVEELLSESIGPAISQGDEVQLVHRESVTPAEPTEHYLHAVDDLGREHGYAGYLGLAADAPVRRLSRNALDAICDTRLITAGFVVPERAVQTQWLADRFIDALAAEPRIEMRLNTEVTAVSPYGDHRLRVTAAGRHEEFDVVINALWQRGQLSICRSASRRPAASATAIAFPPSCAPRETSTSTARSSLPGHSAT